MFVGDSYNGLDFPATGNTPDYKNFAPRFGVAWDVSGNGKTVVRSGEAFLLLSVARPLPE